MEGTDNKQMQETLTHELEKDLLDQYGPMLFGDLLRKALGYRSMDALRQSVCRGTVPVPLFTIKNRRGKFALVKDIAVWLAQQRCQVADD